MKMDGAKHNTDTLAAPSEFMLRVFVKKNTFVNSQIITQNPTRSGFFVWRKIKTKKILELGVSNYNKIYKVGVSVGRMEDKERQRKMWEIIPPISSKYFNIWKEKVNEGVINPNSFFSLRKMLQLVKEEFDEIDTTLFTRGVKDPKEFVENYQSKPWYVRWFGYDSIGEHQTYKIAKSILKN